jgi:cytidylate kinase
MRQHIVIYDRYYFDFISDGKRSNLVIKPSFTKYLYRFIYKPRLNVFLYAQPEVILSRKKEMEHEEIQSLTQSYQKLFGELRQTYSKSRYLEIENVEIDTTIQRVMKAFASVA